jgi:hypothetical protein
MGWQDRDWAKFNEDELKAIYGGGGRRQPPAEGGGPEPGRRVSGAIIGGVVVLVAALTGAYALGRPATSSPSLVAGPTFIYGHAIVFASEPAVCTEIAYNTAVRGWVCLIVDGNSRHLSVIEPKAYDGPCADAVADQVEGRWVCHGNTPRPASELPSTRVF